MVDTGELESYLNEKSCSKGDIVTIKSEGIIGTIEKDKGNKKIIKKVLNLDVEVNGRDLIYTPAKKALEALTGAFGRETSKWIGKQFQVEFVIMQIGTQEINVIKPIPINQKA